MYPTAYYEYLFANCLLDFKRKPDEILPPHYITLIDDEADHSKSSSQLPCTNET